MRRNISILILLISFVFCSKGQSNDYSKEILGCWKMIDKWYELESNYPTIDSIVKNMKDPFTSGDVQNPYIINFSNDYGKYYEKGKAVGHSDFQYKINGNRMDIENSDFKYFDLFLENDTLLLISDSDDSLDRIISDLEWSYNLDVPKDIKSENLIRKIVCIRVKDCDQYQK